MANNIQNQNKNRLESRPFAELNVQKRRNILEKLAIDRAFHHHFQVQNVSNRRIICEDSAAFLKLAFRNVPTLSIHHFFPVIDNGLDGFAL